jgi:outer membrane protein OmpA-like peptidoglycan-associated protein
LKQQPGIVVTAIEERGGIRMVSGLKDPKAADPSALARRDGRDPAKVRYRWESFISLNPAFAAARELDAERAEIEKQLIRFDSGSARLPVSEARQVEVVASMIGMLLRMRPDAHIVVTGRADDVGTVAVNEKLSQDRAHNVVEALLAQGIPSDRLEAVGLSNVYPLRTGGTEWDKGTNRSVAFRVKQ